MRKSEDRKLGLGIIILFLSYLPAFCQDLEPTQVKFRYGGNSSLRLVTLNDSNFQQRGFMLGWHWAWGKNISEALKISQAHPNIMFSDTNFVLSSEDEGDTLADNIDVVINAPTLSQWGWEWLKFAPALGISMQWEPALLIDNPPEFKTIVGDTTRPIFGFKTIEGEIIGSRLKLSSNIPNGTIVLTDNWPDDAFYYGVETTADNDSIVTSARPNPSIEIKHRDFNGTDLYLSLNLRREDTSTVQNNDNVLAIRIKYYTPSEDSGWVKFNSIPDWDRDSIINLPNGRGRIRRLNDTTACTAFSIKRSMLPISTDPGRKDITISAKMIFDGNEAFHNLRLRTSALDTISTHIARLKIEVTYLDSSLPVSIDWVRIESKVAQDLFRGYYDSALTRNVQKTFEFFDQPEYRNRGIRRIRFYLRDEHLPEHWGAHRYINKLIGNICVNEIGLDPWPLQRMYYLELPEFWASFGFTDIELTPVSYIKYGYNWDPRGMQDSVRLSSLNFQGGYKGNYWGFDKSLGHNRYHFYDSLHSDYEINYSSTIALQRFIENRSVLFMNDPVYEKFLFAGKPWWAEMWIGNNLKANHVPLPDRAYVGNNIVLTIGSDAVNRPFTGEEIAMQLWEPLILGTKGLIYDLEPSLVPSVGYPTRIGIWHGQKYFNKTTDDTTDLVRIPVNHRLTQAQRTALLASDTGLLYSDLVGSDYITIPTGPNDLPSNDSLWDYTRIQDYLPKYSAIKNILGLDTNRLYIGRKSVRTSLYKIHKWVRANEETLMKLRLQAWLGKGYRRWHAQGSQITSDTMMKQYIDIGNIKTRPIGRVDANGNPYYEQSSIDSGFYDITLLKDTTSPNDTGIYLGVQNRRTDPLIYDVVNNKMIFTPTAEFDQHVQSGADTSLWQSRWWKRQGAREIRIPVNPSFNNFNAKTVSVRELNNLSDWFANEPYNNVIDTILKVEGGDGYIIVKLLPGQGKILRIEFETGDTIGNVVKNNDVKIILNPSMNKISAIFKHPIPKNSKAYIFDYGGRKLLEANGKDFIDEYKIEMDIAQLPSGAYFFSVYNNSKLITDKKFIILK